MVTESQNSTFTIEGSEQHLVATLVQLLAGAVKHHSLYPENHAIAIQHQQKIFTTLSSFLKNNQVLHLTIEKTDIIFDGNVLYQGQNNENDIAFLLARDGVEWIEFLREIELWEIQALLRLINLNRRSDIENDGNITTALWEKDLPHIDYKAVDLTALDVPMLNFKAFQVAPPQMLSSDETIDSEAETIDEEDYEEFEDDIETPNLNLTSPDTSLWQLTDLEQFQLDALIKNEEEGPDTASIIDILFILLLLQDDKHEALDILEFLQDRFLYCLQHQQFKYSLRILATLKKIDAQTSSLQEKLHPLINDFFQAVARPESLRDLEPFFESPELTVPDNEITALWKLLKLLPAEVLLALAPISDKVDIQRYGIAFVSIFEQFGEQSPSILASVIVGLDEKICLLLFPLTNKIGTEKAIPIVTEMALHPSQPVRNKALPLLLKWNAVNISKLFPLIEDPNPVIRETLFSIIEQQRSPKIELLLCKHLQERLHSDKDRNQILACYQALGKVGSTLCIPFLKKCLFQKSSLGTLFATGGGAHKEGAAHALLTLHQTEAKQIVEEGAASLIPDTRSACKKALGGHHAS